MNISLALITKNAEETLDICLSSFSSVASEIVVVDMGSVDSTMEIAKRYTDRVYLLVTDDFSVARNYSFSLCTKEWILWCNQNDELPEFEAKKIRDLDMGSDNLAVFGYDFVSENQVLLNTPTVRLVHRSLNPTWEGVVYEKMDIKAVPNLRDARSIGWMCHSQYKPDLMVLEKIVRGPVAVPGYYELNVPPRFLYHLAQDYFELNRKDEAIPYFEAFVSSEEVFWEDLYLAYDRLAECYLDNAGAFEKSIWESLKIEPRRSEPYCLLGQYYAKQQEWDHAIHWYKIAAGIERLLELLSPYQPKYYTWFPQLQLSTCYLNLGDMKKALFHISKGLEFCPTQPELLHNKRVSEDGLC